jgi:hypothetical protein
LRVWVAGGVSGAHLNPAVTLAHALSVAQGADLLLVAGRAWGSRSWARSSVALGAYLYDFAVRDVLIARGSEPDPEIEEAAETAIDEPGGAAQT